MGKKNDQGGLSGVHVVQKKNYITHGPGAKKRRNQSWVARDSPGLTEQISEMERQHKLENGSQESVLREGEGAYDRGKGGE